MNGPSVLASVRIFLLQADNPRARATQASRSGSRRAVMRAGSISPEGVAGRSAPGDRRAPPAILILLQDRAQPAHRLGGLAPVPAARPEGLHDAVGDRGRLGLGRELDVG